MTDKPQQPGQAGEAVRDIEDIVRRMIRHWEDTDDLPSDLANRIVITILTHKQLHEALRNVGERLPDAFDSDAIVNN